MMPVSMFYPLEAGVVVLVPVLQRGARVELSHVTSFLYFAGIPHGSRCAHGSRGPWHSRYSIP